MAIKSRSQNNSKAVNSKYSISLRNNNHSKKKNQKRVQLALKLWTNISNKLSSTY